MKKENRGGHPNCGRKKKPPNYTLFQCKGVPEELHKEIRLYIRNLIKEYEICQEKKN